MKLHLKKIFAVEILALIGGLSVAAILFLLIYPYNWFYKSERDMLAVEINKEYKVADSLSYAYNEKEKQHFWFYDLNAKESGEYYNITSDQLWANLEVTLHKDSLEYFYNNVWDKDVVKFLDKVGFHDANSFKSFIEKNKFTDAEIENYENSKIIEKEVETLIWEKVSAENKIIPGNVQNDLALKVLIFILILLYPFRLLYFVIAWSIAILKE